MQKHFVFIQRLTREFLGFWLILFILIYLKHEIILKYIFKPIGPNTPVLATHILSPLMIPLELSIDFSFFLSLPFAILQMWRFISPGLIKIEKKIIFWMLCASFTLFGLGLFFCWWVILPFIFSLLHNQYFYGIQWMPSWQSLYEFELFIEGFFGLAFQIPLLILLLIKLKLIEVKTLKKYRPYVIVSAFTLGMLVTPPDVSSQIIVAIPLCLLYELGIGLCICLIKK